MLSFQNVKERKNDKHDRASVCVSGVYFIYFLTFHFIAMSLLPAKSNSLLRLLRVLYTLGSEYKFLSPYRVANMDFHS